MRLERYTRRSDKLPDNRLQRERPTYRWTNTGQHSDSLAQLDKIVGRLGTRDSKRTFW